jgi:DNA polymerase-3 subunit alpha
MLNNHTYYSLRYGSLSIKELLEEASENILRDKTGWGSFVLTDINTTSAILDFVRLAPNYQINPIIGIDFRNGMHQQFIGIAQNNNGFLQLNQFLTKCLHAKKNIPDKAPNIEDCFIIYPLKKYTGFPLKPWEYVGVRNDELFNTAIRNREIPMHRLVALHTGTFRNKKDFNAHRLLRAINNNTLLSKLPFNEQASQNDLFISWNDFSHSFRRYEKLVENTKFILKVAAIDFNFKGSKNKKVFGKSEEEDFVELQYLTYLGYKERYPVPTIESDARLEKELKTIKELEFTAYFLINSDIVKYARRKGFYYVGRGSGANSMVAYCLYITNVDPIDLDLYFERFINKHRKTPPDFDIDFSWTDRDKIISYIFQKYTKEHTSILATYNTFKYKSAIREIGKVFGLPKQEIDTLTRHTSGNTLDQLNKLTLKYSSIIQHFPNHLGIHAGGIVISDKPINYYTAQEMPPKGFPITQFSMQEAEDVGLHKFDILSQRGLGKIKDAIQIIKENKNIDLSGNIQNIELLKKDLKIKDQLKKGNTIGCFYIESPGMRMLLTKLQANDYSRLVAASSIIRPGVSKSGMMREYIIRYRYPEKRKYTHPKLAKLLKETYGVMVYQEDVLKVAHFFAGLTLEQADILRRGMSPKFRERNEFNLVENAFFNNCKKFGYPEKIIEEVWTQIESFGSYAFSKGHSASYAVESFQSLYLKAYFPLEYMVATINNGGGFYQKEIYIHEAKMHGGKINGPCVNNSGELTKLYDDQIFLGLSMIYEINKEVIQNIEQEKLERGSFEGFNDFINRINIPKKQLLLLIRAGAFNFTKQKKKILLWEANLSYSETKTYQEKKLFFNPPKKINIPQLEYHKNENIYDQLELLGFPLKSPFTIIEKKPQKYIKVEKMSKHINQEVTMLAYFVFRKTVSTNNKNLMYFGTFLDENGQFLDTTHFPNITSKYPFKGYGIYLLKGKINVEFDFYSLEISYMERLYYQKDKRFN